MVFRFGKKIKPKYLSIVFGSEWEKEEFKFIGFNKTPLGWDFNIWRISVSYDNWKNVNRNE